MIYRQQLHTCTGPRLRQRPLKEKCTNSHLPIKSIQWCITFEKKPLKVHADNNNKQQSPDREWNINIEWTRCDAFDARKCRYRSTTIQSGPHRLQMRSRITDRLMQITACVKLGRVYDMASLNSSNQLRTSHRVYTRFFFDKGHAIRDSTEHFGKISNTLKKWWIANFQSNDQNFSILCVP